MRTRQFKFVSFISLTDLLFLKVIGNKEILREKFMQLILLITF